MFDSETKLSEKRGNDVVTIKESSIWFFETFLFYEIKSLLFIKERKKVGILRFFDLFLKIWKIEVIYRVDKMEERADFWLTSTSALKDREVKLF